MLTNQETWPSPLPWSKTQIIIYNKGDSKESPLLFPLNSKPEYISKRKLLKPNYCITQSSVPLTL